MVMGAVGEPIALVEPPPAPDSVASELTKSSANAIVVFFIIKP